MSCLLRIGLPPTHLQDGGYIFRRLGTIMLQHGTLGTAVPWGTEGVCTPYSTVVAINARFLNPAARHEPCGLSSGEHDLTRLYTFPVHSQQIKRFDHGQLPFPEQELRRCLPVRHLRMLPRRWTVQCREHLLLHALLQADPAAVWT